MYGLHASVITRREDLVNGVISCFGILLIFKWDLQTIVSRDVSSGDYNKKGHI